MVQNAFKKIDGLAINAILPLHGPVYKDEESINFIMDKYNKRSTFTAEEEGVVIVYASMYGDTEEAADILATKLAELGVENIKIYDVAAWDVSHPISDCHRFSHSVFAPINYNSGLYYKMDAFLRELVGTGFSNKTVSFLNNWSWGGRSLEISKEILSQAKLDYVGEDVKINSGVKMEQVEEIEALAKAIKADMDSKK